MKKSQKNRLIIFISTICMLTGIPYISFASEGDCGYEGGISSGVATNKMYPYKEVVFVSGKPILLEGNLTLKKTIKNGSENWTYVYSGMKNTNEKATMTRTVSLDIAVNTKSNGQIQRQVSIKGIPTEIIKVDKKTYTMKQYNFTKSTLVDVKPIANYFAGEFIGEKTYNVTGGTDTGTLKVTSKGKVYGYNQNWSNTETQEIEYYLEGTQGKKTWAGKVKSAVSMTTSKVLNYEKNEPDAISFEGGYVQTENNVSVVQYSSELPELDSAGEATDHIVKKSDTARYETLPKITRLVAPMLRQIKGHWAEEAVKVMYAVEIFSEKSENFKPNQFMTRAEFAKAIVLMAKLMTDEEISMAESKGNPGSIAVKKSKAQKEQIQVFTDVPIDYPYFDYIMKAYDNKLMTGETEKIFGAQKPLTRAQAVSLMVRALGFEDMAPSPIAVTSFKDNDSIPAWAKNAAYMAEKFGLVKGDSYGNFDPNKYLTKAEVAIILKRFVDYMCKDIIAYYRENLIQY